MSDSRIQYEHVGRLCKEPEYFALPVQTLNTGRIRDKAHWLRTIRKHYVAMTQEDVARFMDCNRRMIVRGEMDPAKKGHYPISDCFLISLDLVWRRRRITGEESVPPYPSWFRDDFEGSIQPLMDLTGLFPDELGKHIGVSRWIITRWMMGEAVPPGYALAGLSALTDLQFLATDCPPPFPIEPQVSESRGGDVRRISRVRSAASHAGETPAVLQRPARATPILTLAPRLGVDRRQP